MRSISTRAALAVVAAAALAFAAGCGGSDESSGSSASADATTASADKPVTLTWWHNGTTDPLKADWAKVATDFQAAHPNVTIKNQPIQNEQFPTKVPLALQGGDPPDVYQQWGGGQEATQIKSGKVMDLTDAVKGWIGDIGSSATGWQVEGKQYGVPFSMHVVGFWYRKDLFEKAGITAPPTTMDEFNETVKKLKAAGIVPVALGGKDRWPDAFWWEYFAVRECSTDDLKQAMTSMDLSGDCFKKATDDTTALLATKPFQSAFLGTPAQQGAGSSAGMVANGKAAMELQGTWEPGVLAGLTSDKKIADKLGWFPFPSVEGGAGDPATALGGGDGFSCTTEATAACPQFLEYILGPEVQKLLVTSGAISVPVNPAAASAITNPAVKDAADYFAAAPYVQTYFDIALPTSQGQALDDAIANFFAGQGDAKTIADSVSQ